MQQRYYDPIAGRFLSVDPVVTDAATGKSFGRYHYGNNNPYKFVDPDGRDPDLKDWTRPKGMSQEEYKAANQEASKIAVVGAAIVLAPVAAAEVRTAIGVVRTVEKIAEKIAEKEAPAAKDSPKPAVREKDVPNRGNPGEVRDGARRTREYGPDGKPARDYDKPHQGHESPHVHEWGPGGREHPGRDYSPWPRGGG